MRQQQQQYDSVAGTDAFVTSGVLRVISYLQTNLSIPLAMEQKRKRQERVLRALATEPHLCRSSTIQSILPFFDVLIVIEYDDPPQPASTKRKRNDDALQEKLERKERRRQRNYGNVTKTIPFGQGPAEERRDNVHVKAIKVQAYGERLPGSDVVELDEADSLVCKATKFDLDLVWTHTIRHRGNVRGLSV